MYSLGLTRLTARITSALKHLLHLHGDNLELRAVNRPEGRELVPRLQQVCEQRSLWGIGERELLRMLQMQQCDLRRCLEQLQLFSPPGSGTGMGIGAEAFVTESDASVSSSSSSSSLSSKTTVLATVQAMLLNDYPDVAMRLRFATYLDEIAAATDVSSPSSLSSPPTAADATAGLAPPGISLSGVYPQTIIGRTICFGGTEGGEEIRLQGSGFARAAKWVLAKRIAETDGLAESLAAQEEAVDVRVLIGRFPCTAVRVVSDSEIVATTPCIVGEASCAAETAAAEEGSVLVKLPSSVTVIIGGIVRSDGSLRDRYNSFFQFERRAVEESASEEGGSSGDEIAEAGGATAADAAAADAAAAAAAAAAAPRRCDRQRRRCGEGGGGGEKRSSAADGSGAEGSGGAPRCERGEGGHAARARERRACLLRDAVQAARRDTHRISRRGGRRLRRRRSSDRSYVGARHVDEALSTLRRFRGRACGGARIVGDTTRARVHGGARPSGAPRA